MGNLEVQTGTFYKLYPDGEFTKEQLEEVLKLFQNRAEDAVFKALGGGVI